MVSDSRGVSNIHTTSSAPRLMLKDSLANGHEDASRGVDPNGQKGRFLQPMQRAHGLKLKMAQRDPKGRSLLGFAGFAGAGVGRGGT